MSIKVYERKAYGDLPLEASNRMLEHEIMPSDELKAHARIMNTAKAVICAADDDDLRGELRVLLETQSGNFAGGNVPEGLPPHDLGNEDLEVIVNQSRDEIFRTNLRLVFMHAKKRYENLSTIQRIGVNFSDLMQEGCIGLLDAIEKFDPDRGFKFPTFAKDKIRKRMQVTVQEQGATIRIPEDTATELELLKYCEGKLASELNRQPTVEELVCEMRVGPRTVAKLKGPLGYVSSYLSDNVRNGDEDGYELQETIADERVRLVYDELVELIDIEYLLESLSPREKFIVMATIGFHPSGVLNNAQIARELGVTDSLITRQKRAVMAKLREALEDQAA